MADREAALAAVRFDGYALRNAAEESRADREIVLAAVRQYGWALMWAAEPLKADREIVLAAVQQEGSALHCAAEQLKADREIVLAAVQQDGSALAWAAEPLTADREIVLAAVQQDGSALAFAAEPLTADREIVLAAVQQDGSAFAYAAEPLNADREFMLAAVQQNGDALKYAAEQLTEDREIVLAAVQQDGSALVFAAKPLKADREIVLAAVRQDGEALESAARRLKADNGFVLEASRLNSEAHEAAARLLGADTLRELEASAQNHFRVKLVFLGHGGAGKTCLRRRLAEDVFADQLPATDGIEMSELEDGSEMQDLRLSVYLWDLGGQDEYMATHPFFLDGFALYALVVDLERYVRSNDNVASSLRFLRTARARAPDAPIALIGTHADSAEVTEPDGVIRQLRRDLDDACPGGITPTLVFVVSSKDGTGVDSLRAELAAHAVTLGHVCDTVPAPTVKLHEELRSRAADSPHLPLRQVVSLATSDACRVAVAGGRAGAVVILDEASALRALERLSGWGAIHYRDSPMLRETVVLRPQWLADAMACIIGPKQAAAERAGAITRVRAQRRCALVADGRLDHARIDELWSAETIDGFDASNVALRPYLLATMHAFELAYPLLDAEGKPTGASLVPSMLPSLRPSGAAPFAGLAPDALVAKMEIRLSFLPPELFPRLIVRLQQYVKAGDCWFNAHSLSSGGMLLARGEGADSRAAITMGGCFDAAGGWFTSAAYATSIVIDARGAHPTALRGLAWRCLDTLQTEYDGVKAAVSLLSSAGNAVDLEDAREAIREGREVRSRGEVLFVDDLKPGALVTGARDADERRFDGDLATAPPGPGNWRARTVAFIESTYFPADMHGRSAPPLLWLLVPTEAAIEDGSWLDHSQWAPATFELRALSEPPEEAWGWALTTLRVPFDVTSQALVHATPYLLRMLRVVLRVGVRDLAAAVARDLGRLVSAVEAKAAIIAGDAADEQPPPAQRRRLEGPSQADTRPVLTPKAPYLDWRALGDAALAASADGGMLIIPDPTRTRAVWMAREHLPASLRAMMLHNDHLKDELSRTKLELAHARVQYPSTWQLQSNGVPVQGLIDVPQGSAEFNEREQLLQAKLPGANLLQLRRVQNQDLYSRYFFERKLTAERHSGNANERQLWMSSGSTPPDVLCNSAHGVDPMFYLQGGSYGVAAYFAEDPLYSHFIRPCPAQPQEGFQLILAQVVLGDVKEFGSAMGKARFDNGGKRLAIRDLEQEPFKEDGRGQYDSWTGTEGDMQWLRPPLARCWEHPREATENGREKRTPWYSKAPDCDGCRAALAQCKAMMADGPRYGRQYLIARFQKAYPQYVLRYSLS